MRIAREVALYNQGSIENGIDDASKVATSFITFVSSSEGIKVHNADDLSDYIQVNSNAISMYRGNTEKMKLTDSSLRLGDTSNNAYIDTDGMNIYQDGNISASFGGTIAQVGKTSTGHTTIQPSGMQIYGSDGTVELANIGYGEGNAQSGTSVAPYYTFGTRSGAIGNYSIANGYGNTASKYASVAEGMGNVASGTGSHAEGVGTTASNVGAHSEGSDSLASGAQSHASGLGTIAQGANQTAIGLANVADSSSLLIVGNGTYTVDPRTGVVTYDRSNALKVDSSGNVRINGDLYVGCNANSSGGALLKLLKVTKSSVSSLNTTISNSAITANMECIHSVLSNPSAQTGDWTVTTSAGSAVISGSISGTTDITLYLAVPRT